MILAQAEGLLVPLGGTVSASSLELGVTGLELHQPGMPMECLGRLVLVSAPIRAWSDLEIVCAESRDAVALVLRAETSSEFAQRRGPVLLRRSPWVTTDALLRALIVITRSHALRGDEAVVGSLEREAAVEVHRRESALLALLHGTTDAAIPSTLLGLRLDRDHLVIAAGVAPDGVDPLRLALATEFPEERSILTENVLFAVLPVGEAESTTKIVSRLRARVGRALRSADDLPIGVGSIVPGVLRLHESAAVARETLRALRFKLGVPPLSGAGGLRVAEGADVSDRLALIRAGDALRSHGRELTAPLMVVAEYDRAHESDLLPTILTALEYRSNTAEAARRLGIHANSLRARLERVHEISGIDLADPVSAMRVMVAFLASPEIHNTARRSS